MVRRHLVDIFAVITLTVAAMALLTAAMGQDEPSVDAVLEEMFDEQEARFNEQFEELRAENDEMRAAISGNKAAIEGNATAISGNIDGIARNAEAIEELQNGGGGPVDPPDPVSFDWVKLINVETAQAVRDIEEGETVTIPPGHTICVSDRAFFRYNAQSQPEGYPPFCAAGGAGDENTPVDDFRGQNAVGLLPGNYPTEIENQENGLIFRVTMVVDGTGPIPPPGQLAYRLQVGEWFISQGNAAQPLINMLHASDAYWTGGNLFPNDLYADGTIDPETMLPVEGFTGWISTGGYFKPHQDQWADEWVLLWDGDADVRMTGQVHDVVAAPNRVEFKRLATDDSVAQVTVTRVGSGFSNLALIRKSDEARYRDGKIYTARWLDMVARYDLLRAMDMQHANRAQVTSVDNLATMRSTFWGNTLWQSPPTHLGPDNFSFHPRRSMPVEAVFRAAVEADVELWFHAPMALGSPKTIADFNGSPWQMRAFVRDSAQAIIDSPEWARYADHVVEALIASGYPSDRQLILSLDNEIWNTEGHYAASQQYANGIGMAVSGLPDGAWSEGYGRLMAHFAAHFEDALERAGREQNVVYNIETQTANPDVTRRALERYKLHIDEMRRDWSYYAERSAVGPTNYWGGQAWYFDLFPEIVNRPCCNQLPSPTQRAEEHAKLHNALFDFLEDEGDEALAARMAEIHLTGPDTTIASLPWILKHWRMQRDTAARYGITRLYAYEGGSHDDAPSYFNAGPHRERLQSAYVSYMQGEEAARINDAVNDALIAEFPGLILANYATVGLLGSQPWFDGYWGEGTPTQESWAKYDKVGRP